MSFVSDAQRRWFFANYGDDIAAQDQWAEGLSTEQKDALHEYSRGAGTNGPSQRLNESLREGKALTGRQQEMVRQLDSAIETAPAFTQERELWRGVNFGHEGMPHSQSLVLLNRAEREERVTSGLADFASRRFAEGSVMSLGGYQSTSVDIEPALDAALSRSNPGVLFKIRATKGVPLHKFSNFNDESEFLLSRHTQYRVNRVEPSARLERLDGSVVFRTIVHVTQLGGG